MTLPSLVDAGPAQPCPEPFSLVAHVLAPAASTPDRIALAVVGPTGAERWSYARLAAAVGGTAAGLAARGLAPGDRVLLRLGNSAAFPVAFLGAVAAGCLPVPTSAQLTASEAGRIAAMVAPALIIADPGVALPDPPGCPVLPAAELDAFRSLPPAPPRLGPAGRPAYIVTTSGTSGQPRAVVHAHRAVWARRMMWAGWYGLTAADRLLHAGAFNWTYTLGTGLMDPWAAGATALIPAAGVTPAQLPLLLARFEATLLAAAPGVYRQMLKAGPLPALPALRHGLSAGEKMPEATHAAWRAATGRPVFEAFGMSECSTFLSGSPSRPAPAGAVGYAQPGRRIAVLGPDGAPVPRGSPGVLAVGRDDPGLFLGYLGQEEETAARFRAAWFVTGDLAVMADDGAVTHLGRDDDMMNAGGYRVAPGEVETALATHPAIVELAAAEVRVRSGTGIIAAFYVAAEALDEEELSCFAAERLARYKQPRLWVRMAALPRGPTGKVLRRALRETWQAEARHDPA
ncbi:MAG: acyl--CoA ligase [Rhodobacteraceae bacterium]|jgi:acyl-coenzyme A synthetase/AMP-(fatty) acid ligase|nr:acyl--CoA ligase [Paracoccaceae bacterium]